MIIIIIIVFAIISSLVATYVATSGLCAATGSKPSLALWILPLVSSVILNGLAGLFIMLKFSVIAAIISAVTFLIAAVAMFLVSEKLAIYGLAIWATPTALSFASIFLSGFFSGIGYFAIALAVIALVAMMALIRLGGGRWWIIPIILAAIAAVVLVICLIVKLATKRQNQQQLW